MPEHRRLPDLPMCERLNDDGTAGDRVFSRMVAIGASSLNVREAVSATLSILTKFSPILLA